MLSCTIFWNLNEMLESGCGCCQQGKLGEPNENESLAVDARQVSNTQ